ncbi:hypothetical protein AzCIB_2175 [Azoarcus sp. CIB]|uniref:DUF748 domain-containing protein n=1 Tax=Aromatoleum sp. (strain CIB) TaxID=198107 RepID=UPI00067CE9BF|nr:DUF748 domain-containing protein [Azoarcus sp. CIB]AKU12070.1 hypothetical protein AzCIB_2175 [Azoarcus sp. CIB]
MSVEAQARSSRFDPARLKRLAKWAVGTVLAIAVLGFLAAPPLVRHFGQKIASDALGRQITIQDIDINPFALTVTATGLDIAEADGQPGAFSFRSLYANLEGESIFRGAPVLREIRLEAPRVNFVRLDETRHSWSDVQERLAARPKSEDDKPALFSLNNIQLVDGAVYVEDRLVGVKNEITDLTIGMPFVSNLPVKIELFIEPVVSAHINGRPLQLVGRTRPFANDRDTILELKLDGFDFTPYTAYLPFKSAIRLPEGRVSTDLELAFSQAADETPKVVLKGSVDFASITLQDANGAPLLGIPTLSLGLVDVQPLARKFHFDRLEIGQPTVNVVRLANGRLNFQEILPPPSADKPAAPAPAAGAGQVAGNPPNATPPAPPAAAPAAPEPLLFTLDNAKIIGATIRVEDRAAGGPDSGGEPFRTEIKDLQFEARNVSTAPDAVAELALDFATDAGEKSSHRDRVRLSPLEVEGRVAAENFLISRYLPYYAAQLPGGDVRGGRADATVQYKVTMAGDEPHIDLLAEAFVLREFELALKGQKQPVAKLARFAVNDVKVVPADRAVSVGSVESSGAAFAAVRDKQGKLDVLGLVGEQKPDNAAAAAKPAKIAKPPKGGKPQSADDGAAKPWAVTVNKLALDDWSARFEDRTQGSPIVLLADAIKLGAEGISTVKGSTMKLDLAARVNKRGSVGVKGVVGMEPLKGDLSLDLKAVDLLPLQPYVVEQLNIAISRGNLSTRGKLAFEPARDGSLKASFRGDVGVDNFASIDKAHAADFLRWKKLAVTGIDFRLAPLAVAVNEISLNDFYTRLILDEKGRLNLREIRHRDTPEGGQSATAPAAGEAPPAQGPAASGKAEATVAPPSEPPPPISIGKIAIKQGNIEFSDRFIRPNYDANLTGMEGELVGLSSDPSTIAKLDLRGKVDNAAPVTVAGQLNPFRQDRYLDITASVKDFELTAISAYSGRYVGYGIQKGKLSADLHYKIEDRKLTATNRVFLDQLTFGDKVDSPTALDLPVQLAVSLLKNGRGEIDLNMPIGGSLDDPEFSVAGIVFKAIINLIGKALTAPFALLGSMFGGGEELSYIEFAPGRASLDTATTEKVATLARALADRPALKMEITAYADPATDPDGVRRVQMERSVKAAKLKEMVRKGEEAPSLDELTLTQEEYATWLRKVYRDADFKRPRNAIGLLKDLPVEEMEALILANTKVDDEALRQLALQRGQVVKDKLLEGGKVAAERVFLLSPKVEAPDGDKAGEEGAARRAMFSLK